MFPGCPLWLNACQFGYMSAAVAYAWHRVTTERFLNVLDSDHLAADFSAYNIGGRIEGGYRFALPARWTGRADMGSPPMPRAGSDIPHPVLQRKRLVRLIASAFALTYDARTITTLRTELGAWLDWSSPIDHHTALVLRTPPVGARRMVQPEHQHHIPVAAGIGELHRRRRRARPRFAARVRRCGFLFRNGFSIAARFDGEFAEGSRKYAGGGRLRNTW